MVNKVEAGIGFAAFSIQALVSYCLKRKAKNAFDTKLEELKEELNSELNTLRLDVDKLKATAK